MENKKAVALTIEKSQEIIGTIRLPKAINTEADEMLAADCLKEVKTKYKTIEEYRKFFTDPLQKEKSSIDKQFKPIKDRLIQVETHIKKQMCLYRMEKQKLALAQAQETPMLPVEAPKAKIKTDNATVSYKKIWEYEVTDFSQIPEQYLTVDNKKIMEAIHSGMRDIPGVKLFQTEHAACR